MFPERKQAFADYHVLADVTAVEKYSYSKLNTIWQCPFSYDLVYNKKDRGQPNGFAECGSLTHEVLEKYLKHELLQFELKDYFLEHFDSSVSNGVNLTLASGYSLDLTEKYKEQISKFLENFAGFAVDGEPLEILEVEKRFAFLLQLGDKRFILNGVIDVLAKDQHGNLYVLDHKSKKEFKSAQEREHYTAQLYLYSVYVNQKYGKYPIKLVFDLFRAGRLEVVPFDENNFHKALQWAYESIQKIEEEELFLPIDFTRELRRFQTAKENYDDLAYSYAPEEEITSIKKEYRDARAAVEDKLFFCSNLCGHSSVCSAGEDARNQYQEILKGGYHSQL